MYTCEARLFQLHLGKTQNGIAVTSAGLLPMKHVIHVAPQGGGSSQSAWQTLVIRALTEADKRGITSIAFPALGTGNLQHELSSLVLFLQAMSKTA